MINHVAFPAKAVQAEFPHPGLLRLRLHGPLTSQLVDRLQALITQAPADARDVLLDAAGLDALDPVAAARLWLFCDRSSHARRRRIRIDGLDARLVRQLSRHPLRAFLGHEEAIFDDPFATLAASER